MRTILILIAVFFLSNFAMANHYEIVQAVENTVVSPTGNVTTVFTPADTTIFSNPEVQKINFDGEKYIIEIRD